MTQDGDLDLMLADGTDVVTIGGDSVATTVWTSDEAIGGDSNADGQNMGMSWILLRASRFPSLTTGDLLIVNGNNQRAGSISRVQDGKVLHVWLGVF